MSRAIVWLKRDLRLKDNRVFEEASKYREVIPIFIFDEEILQEHKAYDERLSFLIEAVSNLPVKVYLFRGKTEEIFKKVLTILKPDAVITQKAYTWDGEIRVSKIRALCKEFGTEINEVFDGFLSKLESIPERKVFSPFYRKWLEYLDLRVSVNIDFYVPELNLPEIDINTMIRELSLKSSSFDVNSCLDRFNNFNYENYEKTRDFPYLDGTSKLSPCIRFGIISLREIFNRAKISETFVKELAWREFWYHIKLHFPWTKDMEFQEKRRRIEWENKDEFIEAFMEGRTGYPIIDAGIRQLKEEKWMHNRVRMIVASFLTKDLLVDWRIGEKFFKHHLIDYDQVVNIGNWQWVASVGADPKPLRIFNPIIQSQKFDPHCEYIKKYLPELSKVPCHMLHDPIKNKLPYHKPIVNHYERVLKAKLAYLSKK